MAEGRLLEFLKNPFRFPNVLCGSSHRRMQGLSKAPPAPENNSVAPNIPSLHTLDKTSLAFIVNHVFLPPKLPNCSDCTPEHEASLIHVFKESAEMFASHLGPQSNSRRAWDVVTRMLASMASLHDLGIVEEDQLDESMDNMDAGGKHNNLSALKLI